MKNTIYNVLNKLSRKELLELLDAYDTYIQNLCYQLSGFKLVNDVLPKTVIEFYEETMSNK